jgi:hypothetical protein
MHGTIEHSPYWIMGMIFSDEEYRNRQSPPQDFTHIPAHGLGIPPGKGPSHIGLERAASGEEYAASLVAA